MKTWLFQKLTFKHWKKLNEGEFYANYSNAMYYAFEIDFAPSLSQTFYIKNQDSKIARIK